MSATPTVTPTESPAESKDLLVLTRRGQRERKPANSARPHDFRQSGFLTPSELRSIRVRHEQFIRSLAARLAIFLRLEFALQLSKVQIVGYLKFTESLASPTHITLFKTDPLKGVGLLVIPPGLGLTIVDRLLGGPGQKPETVRDLSEIEISLIDQIATLVVTEWCNHWPEMKELRPSLIGHENNSKFLQTAPPDTAMLILSMAGGVGEQVEHIHLAFPYATVEPLMRLLAPSLPETDAAPTPTAQLQWNGQFDDVRIPLKAEWNGLKATAGEISRLKIGDVLWLDGQSTTQVQLRLSHVPKFFGRPGTCGGKWAVELTTLITD